MKRLFVPVTTEVFEDYYWNGKEWEIRACKGQYKAEAIIPDRKVEIRKGYSGSSIWRKMTGKFYLGTLESIFKKVPLDKAEPRSKTIEDAIQENREMIKQGGPYIAFKVIE